jgi:PAS domain S-box-containing protein
MASVRILIADDHELVRQGLRSLLASRPSWEVCGEAADGREAIEKAAQLKPDIVLLDVSMPRLNGLEAARIIRRESPGSEILIVSQHTPAEMLPSALKVGARGFVSKSELACNLLSTIESIVTPSGVAPRDGAPAEAAARARPAVVERRRTPGVPRRASDTTERRRAEDLLLEQNHLLELIARGRPLDDCLGAVAESVMRLQPRTRAGVVMADDSRTRIERVVTAGLPPGFGKALQGLAIDTQTLGTSSVTCSDIAGSDEWSGQWQALCTAHNLRAVHFTPVWGADGKPVASFFIAFDEARAPSDWERDLGQFGAHVGSLAIERARAEGALRHSELKFRTLFQSIDEGFCVLQKLLGDDGRSDYRYLQANPGFATQTGAADVVGRTVREVFPADADEWVVVYDEILASGESRKFEPGRLAEGRVLDAYAFRVEDGTQSRVALICKDITDRKHVEEALRQRSAQFEILVNQAPIGIYLVDDQLRLRQVNPVARPAFGEICDLIGRDFSEVMHILWEAEFADEIVQIFRHTLATGESYQTPERIKPRLDRKVTEYYEWRAERIPLPEGSYGVVCYLRDIALEVQQRVALQDARDRLESRVSERTEELERAYQSLRVLSARMMQMQDEDRRRIARDLHDSAGQLLAALGMELASLNERAAALDPQLARDLRSSHELVQQLTREIRTASYLLHPPLLDDTGLGGALRWYVAGLSKRSGIAITLDLDDALGRLPRELEAAVFHIVQESLMNIHRHSGSKTAALRIARRKGRVLLEIEDQGSGIPDEQLRAIQAHGSGVGIAGMRERVRHFNGDIHISSASTGTRIVVTFPTDAGAARTVAPPHLRV